MYPPTAAHLKRVATIQADLADGLRAILTDFGCELRASASPAEVVDAYANYKFRRIPIGPRRVHWSDTLSEQTNLSSDELAAIKAIEAKALVGKDLYPHQSCGVAKPLTPDGLLADWQIQHLHLGLPNGRPARRAPFVNRSGIVLLARITDHDAYFIAALPHGGGEEPWWNMDLPETLHRNWPQSIERFKVDGYEPKLTWEEHRKMRPPKGCSFMTAVTTKDGTSYLLSDILANGHRMQAGRFADQILTIFTDLALALRGNKLGVVGAHGGLRFTVQRR